MILSKKDRKILNRALRMAQLSTCTHRHGAVVTKSGRTLGVGINVDRNHPDHVSNPKYEAAIHAEIAAIKACGRNADLRGATLYVARAGRNGKAMMSKPCVNCQEVIDMLGIKRVIYTVDMMMSFK